MAERVRVEGPHAAQPVYAAGAEPADAAAAMVLLHGRYSTAQNILTLMPELDRTDLAFRAPQAAEGTWYPYPFLAPLEDNEPHLSSALGKIGEAIDELERSRIPAERIVLLGFSQGACLTCELALRNPRRWGGIVALTGGFLGPLGEERRFEGSFDGTPVLLATSDPDPHVPVERVEETAELFRGMGADVDLQVFPGMGHTVSRQEIDLVRRLLRRFGPA